jgi:serine/threonine-protein kinase RsbW
VDTSDNPDPSGAELPAVVRLSVPAAPAFVQVARLAGSALASRAGFSIDEVDDLRIAIDELAAVLVQATGTTGALDLVFELDTHCVRVAGSVASPAQPELSELTEKILDVVADSYAINAGDGTVSFSLEKRHAEDEPGAEPDT